MKKEQQTALQQGKADYQTPKVEVFRLGESLNFLEQGFSSNGELDPFLDGEELGVDEQGTPIG